MSISLGRQRHYFKNCNPSEPLTQINDPRYVDFDSQRDLRGADGSCIDELFRTIMLGEAPELDPTDTPAPVSQIFTGFPGAGKTTELHRLKARLENDPDEPSHVVFLNAEDFINRHTPPSITDMLRVLAYFMDREATRAEGKDPDKAPGYLNRLWTWLQSDAELKTIGFDAYGPKLMFEIRNNPTFRQKAEALLQLRFQEFAEEAHNIIEDAIVRLRAASGQDRVVLIVDGLEKFSAVVPEQQSEMEASIESVFSNHARWLRLPCHTVYTCPLWLRFRTVNMGTAYNSPIKTLPMIKVRDRAGQPHSPGYQKLTELLMHRLQPPDAEPNTDAGLIEVFGEGYQRALDPMIEASGGYPRDLLRMVRDAITLTSSYPIDLKTIQRVIDRVAEEYKMITLRSNEEVLHHIATTHTLPTGSDRLAAASRCFEEWQVLTYRNGEEWYDLHPLVRRYLASKLEAP
jgi:hypothetical protein